MKFNSIILSGILAMGCVTASAQEADKTVNVFNPHWYVQAQVGGQYTLGEIGFSDLISPNAQVGLGYNFNKVVGARLSFNAWQSKGGQKVNTTTYKWKWNYVAPMVDATFNLTNLFCEYNPERVVSVGVFGGIGANIAWSNEEAATAQAGIMSNYKDNKEKPLEYLWEKTDGKGSKAFFVARLGANVDFRVSDRVSLGLEVSANTLSDHYNSKKAGNPDWYFNALVGAKIALGKTHTTKTIPAPKPVEKIIERVIEKQVVPAPAPVETKKEVAAEEFRRDIFFTIGNSVIAKSQASKITEIVNYMKENPDAKITLTGYADKGTGSDAINDKVAARRAQTVYNALAAKGVAKSRMIKKSAGSRVQPFSENGMNRVTICIAK
ncbi:OmpA family protein [Segatella copri]|uniref:OmpA family protein n=1 Tax=Segatella copri TaxID=165179 RepID=A0AAW4MZ45_9BACT|nr:OmpA family protein [Segatella copri]MBV3387846.1 OmpA family protein [Segatella copri]MBV3395708.1 OmpA family protein [Segatella copri]MBV3405350.1 OmpA family protein [Segatella copri]